MGKIKRKANSYPPEFQRLFLHVAETQEPFEIILPNEAGKGAYTSLRQNLNAFRARYREEITTAVQAQISHKMDGVTVRLLSGPWRLVLEPTDYKVAKVIAAQLPSLDELTAPKVTIARPPQNKEEQSAAESIVSKLFSPPKT